MPFTGLTNMRRTVTRWSATVVALAALAGCKDFLNKDNLQNDPNNPKTAGVDNLFVSAQTNITVQQTGQLARTVCIWMQQCSGQIPPFNSIDIYGVGEDDYYSVWAAVYGGGGLIDLRNIQTSSLAKGDSIYAGQASVLEALLIGMAADVWGDIPYSEASKPDSVKQPTPDTQEAVYDSLEVKLATAITLLAATSGTNFGSGAADLIYGGDPVKWTELAHTLRARYYLHVAKRVGAVAYDSALAEAQVGLQPGDDYVSINSSSPTSANLWSQFTTIYANNMGAGAFLVDYLNDSTAAPDPRLAAYFVTNDNGDYEGAAPGQSLTPSQISTFNADRVDAGFQQPIVTAAENQLIAAEAALGKTAPNASQAGLFLHAEQDAAGVPNTTATLHNVMLEKYIALFQNVEVWSDWRRTNFPVLTPYNGGTIPRRLVYPLSERQVNGNLQGHDPASGRNWNDP